MQAFLFLAHWFIFHTVVVFWGDQSPAAAQALRTTLFVLAFSFIFAALLSFRFANPLITAIYRIAAVWLGFLNFFFFAACICWLANFALLVSPYASTRSHDRPIIAAALFAVAFLAGIYGLFNALWIRVRRISVDLPNLPLSWRGRTALVISDLHVGNVNGAGFSRRVARKAAALRPDIAFIPGDFFDGTRGDPDCMAAPFREFAPPLGTFFSTGNHDEYGDLAHYLVALNNCGIRVLANEKVLIDGLTILGVSYGESTHILRLRTTLERLHLDPAQPSILLSHVPNRLPIAEQAGVSLQLSGHTHGGQIRIPMVWEHLVPSRYGARYAYGHIVETGRHMIVSGGLGTSIVPVRLGVPPEIVQLEIGNS